MEELVYLNGDLIPSSQARLSPFDHGFLYGYGLFETMRSYDNFIFRLHRHLARLNQSAQMLGIAPRIVPFNLEEACHDILVANNLSEARIRITITAGEGDIVPDPATCHGATIFIVARKLTPLPSEIYERGFKTVLSSWRRNAQSPLSHLKSSCYLESVLARAEARAAENDEALLLNESGFITEGSTSNIFLVFGETLVTPSIASGALPGITREAILELAESLGTKITERDVKTEELTKADEAFVTNSILEVMPVTQFSDKPVGTGKPGMLTQKLMQAYKELVDKERQTSSR